LLTLAGGVEARDLTNAHHDFVVQQYKVARDTNKALKRIIIATFNKKYLMALNDDTTVWIRKYRAYCATLTYCKEMLFYLPL